MTESGIFSAIMDYVPGCNPERLLDDKNIITKLIDTDNYQKDLFFELWRKLGHNDTPTLHSFSHVLDIIRSWFRSKLNQHDFNVDDVDLKYKIDDIVRPITEDRGYKWNKVEGCIKFWIIMGSLLTALTKKEVNIDKFTVIIELQNTKILLNKKERGVTK